LGRAVVETVQINVGNRCNLACHHCHVEASPLGTKAMSKETADRVLELVSKSPGVKVVDITGGAPELNPNVRALVTEARALGRRVLVRTNLTILLEAGMTDLPRFFADNGVAVIASMPCYLEKNVNRQRGKGVFQASIGGLRALNAAGYGDDGSNLELNLVYNPAGASLPPSQAALEADYKKVLARDYGVRFTNLLTITNLPLGRFGETLRRSGQFDEYLDLLVASFNPATMDGLMCRSQVSVGWDGRLFDCDFNLVEGLACGGRNSIWDLDSFADLGDGPIVTAPHCFGCTAGAGSSCGGSIAAIGPVEESRVPTIEVAVSTKVPTVASV
jgi:radical SAM/Cys-rich protein